MHDIVGIALNLLAMAGTTALFLPLIYWPRTTRFTYMRMLAASPQEAWDALVNHGEITADNVDRHPLLPANLVSYQKSADDPAVVECVYDKSDGQRTILSIERKRIIVSDAPHRYVARVEAINGQAFPFGKDEFFEHAFEPVGAHTQVTFIFQGRTKSVLGMLDRWLWLRTMAKRDQAFFLKPLRPPTAAGDTKQDYVPFFLAFAVVFASIWFFGWRFGTVVGAIILLHEFGHWLAGRITGQASAQVMAVPFLTIKALPETARLSRAADAFCALMGAGSSAVICALALAYYAWTYGAPHSDIAIGTEAAPDMKLALMILVTPQMMAAYNLLHLMPLPFLDGGRVLRALLQPTWLGRPGRSAQALALVVAGATLWTGDYAIAAIFLFCIPIVNHRWSWIYVLKPMSLSESVAIVGGYAATVAMLLFTFVYAFDATPGRAIFASAAEARFTPLTHADAINGGANIRPRFTLDARGQDDIAHDSLVMENEDTGGREDWRFWGEADQPGPYGFVKVADVSFESLMRRERSVLRAELDRVLEKQNIERQYPETASREVIAGAYGRMDSFPLTMMAGGQDKTCRAFHGFADKGRSYITGMQCKPDREPVTLADVVCLMQGLVIDRIDPVQSPDPARCKLRLAMQDWRLRKTIVH